MGVAWVFEYLGTSKEVERHLEAGGAEPCGTFNVDALPYIPNEKLAGMQINYVLHHSNFPQTSFSIAPTDSIKTSPRAICDRGFDLILTKMAAGLTPDSQGKFELSGHQYRLRDFVIRVGTASQVTAVKGVIVEVEYEPSQVASQCLSLLTELMQMFFPAYVAKPPDLINKKSPDHYTALDTLFQYLIIFRIMRNRT